MKFITDKTPKNDHFYLVKCPKYCESGYQIAQYNHGSEEWQTEDGDGTIDIYVTGYAKLPE